MDDMLKKVKKDSAKAASKEASKQMRGMRPLKKKRSKN